MYLVSLNTSASYYSIQQHKYDNCVHTDEFATKKTDPASAMQKAATMNTESLFMVRQKRQTSGKLKVYTCTVLYTKKGQSLYKVAGPEGVCTVHNKEAPLYCHRCKHNL